MLRDLYLQRKNFPEYRAKELAKVKATNNAQELKELRAAKAKAIAEFDLKIAELRAQPATKALTTLRRERSNELTEEKAKLDEEFVAEVKRLYRQGTSPTEMARLCGAGHPMMFYYALKQVNDGLEVSTDFNPADYEWDYSDVTRVHRYALSDDRAIVRMHDTTDGTQSVYLRRADLEVLRGDHTLSREFDESRVALLEQLLDSPESVDYSKLRNRKNPYKGLV